MPYATFEDLQNFVGASRLSSMFTVDVTEHAAFAEDLLKAAAYQIDSVLSRASYVVPITPDAESGLASLLRVHNCALALRPIRQGVVDEPVGVRKAIDDAVEWLKRILSGEEELMGVDKSVELDVASREGRFAFVPTDRVGDLPSNLFSALGGGVRAMSGGRVE